MRLSPKVLRPKFMFSLLGGELERWFNQYIYPRHSEALDEESQGLVIRTIRVPRHPEFISGSYRFGVGLQAGKMLKQVQHDREPLLLLSGEGWDEVSVVNEIDLQNSHLTLTPSPDRRGKSEPSNPDMRAVT